MFAKELARHRGGRAERYEDERKSEDEGERVDDGEAPYLWRDGLRRQLVERDARDERDVRGTSGSTQGDMKETSPAKNAARSETC